MKKYFKGIKLPTSDFLKIRMIMLGVALLLTTYSSRGQNLIDNGSFEDMLTCPGGTFNGIPFPSEGPLFLTNWYNPNAGSSDYFNACSTDTLFKVPDNFSGQQPARTGSGYVGIILSEIGNEYVSSELNVPMVSGHHYYTSYWTVCADVSPAAADQFGAYFSNSVIELPSNTLLNQFTPQVVSPTGAPYADTINWQKVSGTFVANGGEKWMTIGVFNEWDNLNFIPFVEDGGFGIGQLYYYIDDVCVLDMDGSPGDVAIHFDTLCPDPSIKLEARPGMETYTWNDGSTATTSEINQPGIYWVKSVQLNTCSITIDTFKIGGDLSIKKLNIDYDTLLCANASITLEIKDGAFTRYNWSNGDTTAATTVNTPGLYYVTASDGCLVGFDTVDVKAGNCDACLFVPNAFSPNNDGLNDLMLIKALCPIDFFQLNIYNRFGECVFGSTNPSVGWNGEHNNKLSDCGTYFYHIKYRNKANATNGFTELKGDLTLLK